MSEWPALIDELDTWGAAGLTATFWWRDDDAIEPTKQLERLLAVARPLPIAMAVISGAVTPPLAERLLSSQRIVVLQHGWQHRNHGASSNTHSEYPGDRPAADVAKEFREGRERLSALFGERFQPVFTPPWHGFHEKFLPLLAQSGLWSISRGGPRSDAAKAAGLFESNIHAGLLDWSGAPEFVGVERAINRLLAHLKGRRLGSNDVDEPTGILTHHLVQDAPSYKFIERLAEITGAHKAAKWLRASEIFPASKPGT